MKNFTPSLSSICKCQLEKEKKMQVDDRVKKIKATYLCKGLRKKTVIHLVQYSSSSSPFCS